MVSLTLPLVSIRSVVLLQGTLFVWSMLSTYMLEGLQAISMSSLVLLLIGFWCVGQEESTAAVGVYGYWMSMNFLLQTVVLSVHLKHETINNGPSDVQFSFAMLLIYMIVTPVLLFYVYQEYLGRGGEFSMQVRGENSYAQYGSYQAQSTSQVQDEESPKEASVSATVH